MNKIIQVNGQEYLRLSKNIWDKYLDITSPYRNLTSSNLPCALKDTQNIWCDNCNKGIGSWSNSCIKMISTINLVRYDYILSEENISADTVDIELDRNTDNKVI